MRRAPLLALPLALSLAACVPPRERLDGESADGRTRVALDLRPASGDSVKGSGILRVAGRPVTVVLHGKWNDVGDGVRSLDATLEADTMPDWRWSLVWSPSDLNGSLRPVDGGDDSAVALNTPGGG
ncbi:MAG: hypothetical protein ACJ8AD_12645 [Gemmatimonadaceae bacterium]